MVERKKLTTRKKVECCSILTCTPEMALTTVDLPWATWPMVPVAWSCGSGPVSSHRPAQSLIHQTQRSQAKPQLRPRQYPHTMFTSHLVVASCLPALRTFAKKENKRQAARGIKYTDGIGDTAHSNIHTNINGCLPADHRRRQWAQILNDLFARTNGSKDLNQSCAETIVHETEPDHGVVHTHQC